MKCSGFTKLYVMVLILLTSCIDPYNPPQVTQANSYLVVDGYVDLEAGKSVITLSRTKNLSESNQIVKQTNAQVSIQIEGGATYQLWEGEAGVYSGEGFVLSVTDKCKLIINSEGKQYESAVVAMKVTPEIDSVTYFVDDDGVRIDVTTHDPTNSTWYYQWQYEETGKYISKFRSLYDYRGPNDYPIRTKENDIYVCWKSQPSTSILVASSSSLKQDVIYKYPLTLVPSTSWILEHRYSILVKQFAIDEETYNYWIQLKKNTESLGTLFDPQPSQIAGNIRCTTHPDETVLGYFSVRSIREKRLFIDGSDLPRYENVETGYEQCFYDEIDTILLADLAVGLTPGYLLITGVTSPMGTQIIGYSVHTESCIDCRKVRQGTTKRPEWWED